MCYLKLNSTVILAYEKIREPIKYDLNIFQDSLGTFVDLLKGFAVLYPQIHTV